MITGRAKAVTKSSIKALYKVCYRSSYANSIKVAPLCKNLSTATEAYPRHEARVGDDSDPESRGGDGVCGDRSLNSVQGNQGLGNELRRSSEGHGGNWDKRNAYVSGSGIFGESGGGGGRSFDGNVGGNRPISSGNGVGEYRQEWDGYQWSNAKEPSRNSREQAVNLSHRSGDVNYMGGDGGYLRDGRVERFTGGLKSENGGEDRRDDASVRHRVPSGNSGSVSSFGKENYNEYAASNVGRYQQADNNNYAPNKLGQNQQASVNNHGVSNFGQSQQRSVNNQAASNFGQYQQASVNSRAMNNLGQYQQASVDSRAMNNLGQYQQANVNNQAGNNLGQYQQASVNNQTANNLGQYQQASVNNQAANNLGQYQQASINNQSASNFGQYQQANINNQAASNYGQRQWVDNHNYAPNGGAYQHMAAQQNGNVGSQTAHHYQYQGSNVPGYQQNPYGNLIYNRNAVTGPLQSNSNAQYPITGSQVPGNSNMEGNSTDALETPQIRGTIEELEQYTKDGKLKEALEVLELLEKNQQRLVPERDMSTVFMLMEACGEAKADKEAKAVHKALVNLMNPLNLTIYNKILDMYLKCGSIEEAYSLFNDIPNADATSWDTMIKGLVKNDLGEEVIDIFTEFKNTELVPDGQMFLGVFSACGIVGDVTEGMLHFQSMSKQYGITPSMEHYVGVVEMLGHAGYLDNALEFIENMPVKPSVDVWETLMHVSRIQGNVELGDRCAELVEKLDPSRLSEQSKAGLIPLKASDLEKDKEKKKLASKNLLEVRSRVHEYRAGDTSHPENDRIYALLRGLKTQMKEAGYIPELRGVLHDIDPEGKEEALLAHSERLAAAYGFLTTAARQPIRVIKNLRVCVDCHNALKIISKLVGRELIMRDAKRFHHFKDGVCSCKDYW